MAQELEGKKPEVAEMIKALMSAKAYPEITRQVELVQTHISFVRLTLYS